MPMKITAFINRVTAQYKASEALVLPVEAQAARLAPIMRACVNAADMPLSLKLPEGFIPSYCRNSRPASRPTYLATPVGGLQQRLPFADGDDLFAAGRTAAARETARRREKHSGSSRRDHLASKNFQESGGRSAVPIVAHVQQIAAIAGDPRLVEAVGGPAAGEMHRWKATFV